MSQLDLSKLTEAEAVELETLLDIESRTSPYSPHEPTDRQRLFLKLPHSEAFYGGAAGGGKSDALLMAALQYADVPGYSALILRRTYQDLSKPGALMDRSRAWLAGSGARWNEQKKQWRFPSGAVVAFGYLENDADRYQFQGAEYQGIFFDELTQFNESSYTYLFSRLRRLANTNVPIRMRSASNPGGIGAEWVQQRFIPDDWTPEQGRELAVIEKNGRAFVPAKLVDNPHLDQESYERSLHELDEVTRAQLLDGDWQVRERGNIYKAWTDGPNSRHVITWSQFKSVFKVSHIPSHWLGACGQDWGFDPDPCATIWNFVAGENSPLPGAIFCPAILTCRAKIPDHVADEMKQIEEREEWAGRVQYRVMSHEASSQRETYAVKHGLGFEKWKPDAHGGIAQMQNALRLRNLDEPHPFKPWLTGRPNYYVIVPDDQLINPKGDEGLALLRAEFGQYRYVEERITPHLGASRIVPYKHFDHFMDAQRGIAARWFADVKEMTREEKVEAYLPANLRLDAMKDVPYNEGREMSRARALAQVDQEIEQETHSEWERFWADTI